ncbi:MAG TPA: hypothetical protein VGP64_01250 [Polyangia bacterium]
MDGRRPRILAWPLLLTLVATGCYEWVRVPPGELPRLDERPPSGTAVVRDERGKNLEVVDDFAVRVTTRTDSVDFMSPLHCAMKEGTLQLAQDDNEPQSFSLAEIKSTEVYRYDRPLTQIVVTLGIVAAVAVPVLLVGYGLEHSHSGVK